MVVSTLSPWISSFPRTSSALLAVTRKGQSCRGVSDQREDGRRQGLARSVHIASPQPCPNRPLWAAVPSTPGSIPLPALPLAHSILFLVPTEACVLHSAREYNRCSDY